MTNEEIKRAKDEFIVKLNKFNAPVDDVDEIMKTATKHCKNSYALKSWATRIYFQRHPDIAAKIHIDWHFVK